MSQTVNCTNCNAFVDTQSTFCENCGYPENGSQKEQDKFNYSLKLKRDVIKDAKCKIKHVKILLYVLAGINLIAGLYWLSVEDSILDGIGGLVGASIFLACVFWVKKQPLIGILAAFIFWILLQLLVIFEDPALLLQGLLLKVIVIALFIKGVKSAVDYKEFSEKIGS